MKGVSTHATTRRQPLVRQSYVDHHHVVLLAKVRLGESKNTKRKHVVSLATDCRIGSSSVPVRHKQVAGPLDRAQNCG
jgi:hypothetical protein